MSTANRSLSSKGGAGIQTGQRLERFKATDMKAVELDEVFTLEEIQEIIAYARKAYGTANATLLETAFASGMRKGELLGMKWIDVDFEKGLFSVRRNYD